MKYEEIKVYSHQQSKHSEHVLAITLNTERSPRNSHEEGQNGCISVQKYPLFFYRGIVLFGYNNAALFRAQFSLFKIFSTSGTRLKARIQRFNTREYNYIQDALKRPPPPILGQGEPPQGVFLHRRPIFQNLKGCHVTLKSLILIIFCLPVNFLSVPLLDCY